MESFAIEPQTPPEVIPAPREWGAWKPESVVHSTRLDRQLAVLAALVTLAVYVVTLAPSVTLEDSGEFITAAANLGVPHPPGYPLWTMLGFVFAKLVPFGNVAWRVNLQSAVLAGVANGMMVLLASLSCRWLLANLTISVGDGRERLPSYAGFAAAMILGFSDVMWSQAVIAEVYALNAFFLITTLYFFQRWVIDPDRLWYLYGCVFVFALGLTNHHTLLFILPAFLLGVCLLRLWYLGSFMCGVFLLAQSALAVLAWYSNDRQMHEIAWKMGVVVLVVVALTGFWYQTKWEVRKFLYGALFAGCAVALIQAAFHLDKPWGLPVCLLAMISGGMVATSLLDKHTILMIVLLGWLGLLPYGYMPWASATNPPMNWGYARLTQGFYEAINRGQYSDSLSVVIKKSIGPLLAIEDLGTDYKSNETPEPEKVESSLGAFTAYFRNLEENMSLPLCLLALLCLLFWGQLKPRFQYWVIFLVTAFVFLAFLLTIITPPPGYDKQALWNGQVFYLQSHCIFALAVAYGILAGQLWLRDRYPELPAWAGAGAAFLALIPLQLNFADSNQRDHWFGWIYGTDMLRPLAPQAVLFGGTDPGRFVPTYTIFCESQQPARWKRDPSFDRSDVYIITQNALANRNYMYYLRDHYDASSRPTHFSALEKWLGRDHTYPVEPLVMPTDREMEAAFIEYAHLRKKPMGKGEGMLVSGVEEIFVINGLVARLIFEKNKDKHVFYVEESYPIEWMYDYLVPDGLVMRMNPTPLKQMPEEAIQRDREFWDAYEIKLKSLPGFDADFPAQRAFAKLRHSIGNLYAHWHLKSEAEYAYRQSIRILPIHGESLLKLCELYHDEDRLPESVEMMQEAVRQDPENKQFKGWLEAARELVESVKRCAELKELLARTPDDLDRRRELIGLLIQRRKWDEFYPECVKAAMDTNLSVDEIAPWINLASSQARTDEAIALLTTRVAHVTKDVASRYNLAGLLASKGRQDEALAMLGEAVKLDSVNIIKTAKNDPRWNNLRQNKQFQALIK